MSCGGNASEKPSSNPPPQRARGGTGHRPGCVTASAGRSAPPSSDRAPRSPSWPSDPTSAVPWKGPLLSSWAEDPAMDVLRRCWQGRGCDNLARRRATTSHSCPIVPKRVRRTGSWGQVMQAVDAHGGACGAWRTAGVRCRPADATHAAPVTKSGPPPDRSASRGSTRQARERQEPVAAPRKISKHDPERPLVPPPATTTP
jgi:hypothetical protein